MNVQVGKFAASAKRDPSTEQFASDVLSGLATQPKVLLPKYFYDAAGSQLFEEITVLPEYYPTRTELGILNSKAKTLADLIPRDSALIEFGAGSALKAKILLNAAPHIACYIPVDISAEFLAEEARRLTRDIPRVGVHPVAADFTQAFELPSPAHHRPRVGFFPGSTIGNFEPPAAKAFLRQARQILGPDALFIVGADRVKDEATLHAAYNDAAGVTGKFNLNLLVRINRELGGDFDLGKFRHFARFNQKLARIEMHLESQTQQTVNVLGETFSFDAGETIHTESSHKFTVETFTGMAAEAGWTTRQVFSDSGELFSVYLLA